MTLMRYEPWGRLGRLHEEMDRLFNRYAPDGETSMSTSDWTPAVDVKEEENRFLIHADIPGVEPKDIAVHMEKGVLTIEGTRESEATEEKEGYKRVERVYGNFARRFTLPDTADADNIQAQSKHGVLEISIPKKAAEQPRRIEVK